MTVRERPGVAEKRRRLADPSIRRWYDNLARGSEITASNYLRSLYAFARRTKSTPAEIAHLSSEEAYRTLLDFVSAEEKRGVAGSAIVTYVKGARSWLAFNGIRVDRTIKVRGAQSTPTLKDEEVPTQDGVRKILLAATLQQRVAVALVAFSGVRLEVLGNYTGVDGLSVRDLPDLRIENGKATFTSLPARVIVREELSKTKRAYFSFIGAEGASYISAFLESRMQSGERVGPDTDLFHPVRAPKKFIRSVKVSEAIRSAIDRAGFDFRPYNLRCYFDTQLLLAESKGKVAHDYRVFWMGHTGSIENRYTTNKGRLPKDLLADMAQAYQRSEEFLSTMPSRSDADTQSKIAKVMLMGLGYTEKDLAKVDFDNLDVGTFQELVTKKMGQSAAGTGTRQRLVEGEELPRYLEEGWTVVTTVNGHQVVLNPPGSR